MVNDEHCVYTLFFTTSPFVYHPKYDYYMDGNTTTTSTKLVVVSQIWRIGTDEDSSVPRQRQQSNLFGICGWPQRYFVTKYRLYQLTCMYFVRRLNHPSPKKMKFGCQNGTKDGGTRRTYRLQTLEAKLRLLLCC